MIYLVKFKNEYEVLEARCKSNKPFTDAYGNRHFFYVTILDGSKIEFDGRKIVDSTTSKNMEFARNKWAEYLI